MKVTLTKSLYGRLAIAFAVIIALMAAVQMAFVTPSYRQLRRTIEQETNWDLAANLVELLHPLISQKDIDVESVDRKLFELTLANPELELYILDEFGNVVFGEFPIFSRKRLEPVELTAIKRALAPTRPSLPLLSPHPFWGKEHMRIFSVAPAVVRGKAGYVYILLTSNRENQNIQYSGQKFIVGSLLSGIIVISLFAIVLGSLLFRFLTKQFRDMSEVVSRYQEGDYSARVVINNMDEIGQLGLAMNRMADQIVETQRQRRQTIASITHDLRSPLTSIRGFVEMLVDPQDEASEDERVRYLKIIQSNVAMQERLVSDLFELSKLETNDIKLRPELIAIDELVDDIAIKYRSQALEKGLSLNVTQPDDVQMVEVDLVLMERVITNLLTNAIRYSRPGGSCTISVTPHEGHVQVEVADNGVGIPEEDLEYIFDVFYRVEKDRSRESGGSGLGLAIVEKILTLHNSQIQVSSVVGEGTRFWFELAVAHAAKQTSTVILSEEEVVHIEQTDPVGH